MERLHIQRAPEVKGPPLCCLLGSFDPPHLGHERLLGRLLERFGSLLLLVPTHHFQKQVVPGVNAGYAQRMELLRAVSDRHGARCGFGRTGIVLFVELWTALQERFGRRDIFFGMGDDTHAKVVDSRRYYRRLGQTFGPDQQRRLEELLRHIVVFDRSGAAEGGLPVDEDVRWISSTWVRRKVVELRAAGVPPSRWHRELGAALAPDVIDRILADDLYTLPPPDAANPF
ncbi:MAG: adenylyltransferase/cytidyltransferase family protein [bacterium]